MRKEANMESMSLKQILLDSAKFTFRDFEGFERKSSDDAKKVICKAKMRFETHFTDEMIDKIFCEFANKMLSANKDKILNASDKMIQEAKEMLKKDFTKNKEADSLFLATRINNGKIQIQFKCLWL